MPRAYSMQEVKALDVPLYYSEPWSLDVHREVYVFRATVGRFRGRYSIDALIPDRPLPKMEPVVLKSLLRLVNEKVGVMLGETPLRIDQGVMVRDPAEMEAAV